MARLGPRNDSASLYFEPNADLCWEMMPQSRRVAAPGPLAVRDHMHWVLAELRRSARRRSHVVSAGARCVGVPRNVKLRDKSALEAPIFFWHSAFRMARHWNISCRLDRLKT